MSDLSGAKSAVAIAIRQNVSKAGFILSALIFASPVLLLWDGLIVQGLVAGILATALVIIAHTFRPGETAFLVSIIRPPAIVAAVLTLWVIVQVLPLGVFAHPIWKSAEAALKHPIAGTISVDPGASVVALGQYLSLTAVAFLSAAVAVDRQRAEWILFALTGSVTSIALIALLHDLLFAGALLPAFASGPGGRLCRYGSNYCKRGLHPDDRALRNSPLKPAPIGAGYAANLYCMQRCVSYLWFSADSQGDARSTFCNRIWSSGTGERCDHSPVSVWIMARLRDCCLGFGRRYPPGARAPARARHERIARFFHGALRVTIGSQ